MSSYVYCDKWNKYLLNGKQHRIPMVLSMVRTLLMHSKNKLVWLSEKTKTAERLRLEQGHVYFYQLLVCPPVPMLYQQVYLWRKYPVKTAFYLASTSLCQVKILCIIFNCMRHTCMILPPFQSVRLLTFTWVDKCFMTNIVLV